MQWKQILIILGIVEIIILTLVGLYFYRLTHPSSVQKNPEAGTYL